VCDGGAITKVAHIEESGRQALTLAPDSLPLLPGPFALSNTVAFPSASVRASVVLSWTSPLLAKMTCCPGSGSPSRSTRAVSNAALSIPSGIVMCSERASIFKSDTVGGVLGTFGDAESAALAWSDVVSVELGVVMSPEVLSGDAALAISGTATSIREFAITLARAASGFFMSAG
jgi:hypothetical protein